jgi:hypothetical protein
LESKIVAATQQKTTLFTLFTLFTFPETGTNAALQHLTKTAAREALGVQGRSLSKTCCRMSVVGQNSQQSDKQDYFSPNGSDVVEARRTRANQKRSAVIIDYRLVIVNRHTRAPARCDGGR